jgi:hypothetical protein
MQALQAATLANLWRELEQACSLLEQALLLNGKLLAANGELRHTLSVVRREMRRWYGKGAKSFPMKRPRR